MIWSIRYNVFHRKELMTNIIQHNYKLSSFLIYHSSDLDLSACPWPWILWFQQASGPGDVLRLGGDYHHSAVLHLHDVRDAAAESRQHSSSAGLLAEGNFKVKFLILKILINIKKAKIIDRKLKWKGFYKWLILN